MRALIAVFSGVIIAFIFIFAIGSFLSSDHIAASTPPEAHSIQSKKQTSPKSSPGTEVISGNTPEFHFVDISKLPQKGPANEALSFLSICGNTGSFTLRDCMDSQDEFVREYINAYAGDYLAMSNTAFMFGRPMANAVRPNHTQACAWRIVIMRSGSPYLDDLDREKTQDLCAEVGGPHDPASVARAREIERVIRSHRVHLVAVPQISFDPKRDKDEQTAD